MLVSHYRPPAPAAGGRGRVCACSPRGAQGGGYGGASTPHGHPPADQHQPPDAGRPQPPGGRLIPPLPSVAQFPSVMSRTPGRNFLAPPEPKCTTQQSQGAGSEFGQPIWECPCFQSTHYYFGFPDSPAMFSSLPTLTFTFNLVVSVVLCCNEHE